MSENTAPAVAPPQSPAQPSPVAPVAPAPTPAAAEPLPIWFFVGIILAVYGVIVAGSALLPAPHPTVLGETRPGLWWGAIMAVAGGVFLAIGWKGRSR